jgi:AcrR family transcriptional regulator
MITAADTSFRRYGYSRTSLEDVATEAGVSRTAVYHHFPDGKDDLFRAVVEDLHNGVLDAVRAAGAEFHDPLERIQAILVTKAERFYQVLASSAHGVELFAEGDRRCGDIGRKFRRDVIREIADILRQAVESDELTLDRIGGDPSDAAKLLYHAADGLHERHTGRPVSLTAYRRRIEWLIELFRSGSACR